MPTECLTHQSDLPEYQLPASSMKTRSGTPSLCASRPPGNSRRCWRGRTGFDVLNMILAKAIALPRHGGRVVAERLGDDRHWCQLGEFVQMPSRVARVPTRLRRRSRRLPAQTIGWPVDESRNTPLLWRGAAVQVIACRRGTNPGHSVHPATSLAGNPASRAGCLGKPGSPTASIASGAGR